MAGVTVGHKFSVSAALICSITLGITGAGLFLYAVRTLSQSPCLGVADIGDFRRVMRPAGIERLTPLHRPGRYVRCQYGTHRARLSDLDSSTAVLACAAKNITWGLPVPPDRMDLRQMGLLYLTLVGGLMITGVAIGLPGIIAVCILYVVVDPGYLLFFNSFYADPTLLVAMVGLVMWFHRWGALPTSFWRLGRLRWTAWTGALIALVVLGGVAKMMYLGLPAVVLLVITIPLVANGRVAPRRAVALGMALLLLAVLVPLHAYKELGRGLLWANNYHAVYGGIVPMSSHPDRVLRVLDISEEFWNLPRRNVFSGEIPYTHPVHAELKGLSRFELLGLYLADPAAAARMAGRVQVLLSTVASHPRGNRARGHGGSKKKATYETGWQYSKVRAAVFGSYPAVLWLLIAGTVVWLAESARRGRWDNLKSSLLLLLVWALSQMIVVVLGEGLITMQQHLVSTRFALDLMLVLMIYDVSVEVKRGSQRDLSKLAVNEHGHLES